MIKMAPWLGGQNDQNCLQMIHFGPLGGHFDQNGPQVIHFSPPMGAILIILAPSLGAISIKMAPRELRAKFHPHPLGWISAHPDPQLRLVI